MVSHNSIVQSEFRQPGGDAGGRIVGVQPSGCRAQAKAKTPTLDDRGSTRFATRKNQAGSPRGEPAFLVVSTVGREASPRPRTIYFFLRAAFLCDRAGFLAGAFFKDRLALFVAFFGDRAVFLAAFFFVAISVAPRIEHPRRMRRSSPRALLQGKPQENFSNQPRALNQVPLERVKTSLYEVPSTKYKVRSTKQGTRTKRQNRTNNSFHGAKTAVSRSPFVLRTSYFVLVRSMLRASRIANRNRVRSCPADS
jgi:hypothetical protein